MASGASGSGYGDNEDDSGNVTMASVIPDHTATLS